ncbi:hypothetical protein Hanom_Chr01g00009191 [Helianthus anomalus]
MATKCKPQGPRCKKFEIWTKMAKVTKPQGPKWQFTQIYIINVFFSVLNYYKCYIFFTMLYFLLKCIIRFWQVIGWGRFGRSKSRVSQIRDPCPVTCTCLLPHLSLPSPVVCSGVPPA